MVRVIIHAEFCEVLLHRTEPWQHCVV